MAISEKEIENFDTWARVLIARERDCDIAVGLQNTSACRRIIRGSRCLNENGLFGEWAAALQFPYYFGHNWNAFDECLNDLSWLNSSAYVFYVTQANLVLDKDEDASGIFFRILKEASDEMPLKIIFQADERHVDKLTSRLKQLDYQTDSKKLIQYDEIL